MVFSAKPRSRSCFIETTPCCRVPRSCSARTAPGVRPFTDIGGERTNAAQVLPPTAPSLGRCGSGASAKCALIAAQAPLRLGVAALAVEAGDWGSVLDEFAVVWLWVEG